MMKRCLYRFEAELNAKLATAERIMCHPLSRWRPKQNRDKRATNPSEFDLRPTERKLNCGCYVEETNGVWKVTGQAFLCPHRHTFHFVVAPEVVDAKTRRCCPTCLSPSPNRHPSVQYGGETEPCIDPFHDADDHQSDWLKAYIAEKRGPLAGAKPIASVRPSRPFGGEAS